MQLIKQSNVQFIVRVQYKRKGQTPDYSRDVRFFNCPNLASAQSQVSQQIKRDDAWRVELLAVLEEWAI